MKKVFSLALIFAAVTFGQAFAQEKMAVIDIQRCATTSDAGKAASEEMKTMEADRAAKLQPMQDELKKLEGDYFAQEKVLTDAAKKSKQEELQKKMRDYQNMVNTFESELQKKNDELSIKILQDLEKIIETVAKEDKISVIFHRQTIVYTTNLPDITDKVIEKYNAQYKK